MTLQGFCWKKLIHLEKAEYIINDFCGEKIFHIQQKEAEYKKEVTTGQRRLRCIRV